MIKINCSVCGNQEEVIVRLHEAEIENGGKFDKGVRRNESTVCQNEKCVMYINMARVSTWRLK